MSMRHPLPTISIHDDTLRLHNVPGHDVALFMQAATSAWSGWTKIDKLTNITFGPGSPISAPSGEVTVLARQLMMRLLQVLMGQGYFLYSSCCVTSGAMDTMYFEKRESWTRPEMLAVSIHKHDLLRLINAPPNVVDGVMATILSAYHQDNVHVSTYGSGRSACPQFKLVGSPWSSSSSSKGHVLLSHVFGHLAASGWRLYASIQQSGDSNGKDTWYFCHEPLAEVVFAVPAE